MGKAASTTVVVLAVAAVFLAVAFAPQIQTALGGFKFESTPPGDGGTGGSGGSGGDSGTEDLSDYFEDGATPTPIPTSTPTPTATPAGGGTASPTPTPTSGPYDPDLCVHWHMSYCVGESSPTPTPTPAGYEEGTLPPECGSNLETGRTVISNILCIIE